MNDYNEKRFTAPVAAMQGILADPSSYSPYEVVAESAIKFADALLAALDIHPGSAEPVNGTDGH